MYPLKALGEHMSLAMLRYKTLADVAGKEAFKKLLGAKVYARDGEYIGYLKRIYIERKRGTATKIVVRLLNGNLLLINPKDIILEPDGKITLKADIKIETKDILNDIVKLNSLVNELRNLRERILELDEAYIAGELSKETYQRFRVALEQRKRKIIVEVKKLIEELEPYAHKLDEERKALIRQMSNTSGENNADVIQKLRKVRETLARVHELIDSAAYELAMEMELEEFIERYLRMS